MNIKIVLVDDEKLIADGYCYSLLKKYDNLECRVFYNSLDTLEYIKNNECNILICDIDMPVKNGITLAKEIREFNKDIKIIFLTVKKVLCRSDIAEDTNKIEGNFAEIRKATMQERDFLQID